MRATTILSLSILAAAAVLMPACAAEAPPANEDDEAMAEADVGTDDDLQSFDSFDATDAELANTTPASPGDDELTLFAIPAPRLTGLKWKRPGGLARRVLLGKALGLSRALGHAAVRVQCGATATEPAGHFQGSVVDTGDDFKKLVMDEKAGLGVLFATVPGALETEADEQSMLDERYANGRITFARIKIKREVCQGLLGYARDFEKLDVAKAYGFVRPLYKEGAGCSAFSMAFLELANLDEPRFRNEWAFDVRVPKTLIGGHINPGNSVGILKLMLTLRGWASEDEAHMRLIGWDPSLMFTSIRSMAKAELRAGRAASVERRGRAIGIVLDRRNVAPRPELANRTYWAGEPNAPRNEWGFGDP
jgi:hypothetical protein